MSDALSMIVPTNEQEEIRKFISTLLLLSKEDRLILLSSANILKIRADIEKEKGA